VGWRIEGVGCVDGGRRVVVEHGSVADWVVDLDQDGGFRKEFRGSKGWLSPQITGCSSGWTEVTLHIFFYFFLV